MSEEGYMKFDSASDIRVTKIVNRDGYFINVGWIVEDELRLSGSACYLSIDDLKEIVKKMEESE